MTRYCEIMEINTSHCISTWTFSAFAIYVPADVNRFIFWGVTDWVSLSCHPGVKWIRFTLVFGVYLQ